VALEDPQLDKVPADALGLSHTPNIQVIKGRVPEILREGCPDQIAFLHIDMNSAVAEIAALDFLYDRITPGGVIVFDDFGWFSAVEQHHAERRWMTARGLHILEMPTGQGLFVKPC
jgi:predicted O-methyltransferase YrrM